MRLGNVSLDDVLYKFASHWIFSAKKLTRKEALTRYLVTYFINLTHLSNERLFTGVMAFHNACETIVKPRKSTAVRTHDNFF